MTLGSGSPAQKLIFALLVAFYAMGLLINIQDKLERVGQPDAGWQLDDGYVSPTRDDASDAGLRGGGRLVELNGHGVDRLDPEFVRNQPGRHISVGDSNTIVVERADGSRRTVTVSVRAWQWEDVLFTEGATVLIGLLAFVVGTATFFLRPYEHASWALLALCSVAGSVLATLLIPIAVKETASAVYFMAAIATMPPALIHGSLAFPMVHPLLVRTPQILVLVYAFAAAQFAYYVWTWTSDSGALIAQSRIWGSLSLFVTLLMFEARSLYLSFTAADRVIRQRARILFGGSIIGIGPAAATQVLQQAVGTFAIDNRLVYWPLGIFILALARVTLRNEIMNARIAVRRAFMYAWAAGVLTVFAILLSSVRPYAVAAMLFPLLYVWPRFDQRLNARLYPNRVRLPELLREFGERFAACNSPVEIVRELADAPAPVAAATSAVAILFPSKRAPEAIAAAYPHFDVGSAASLAEEPLLQIVRTTRKEITRSAFAVDAQFSNIRNECLACFDRLHAEVVLPILRDNRTIGVLAVGVRQGGEAYESPELDGLTTLLQQAVQALIRIDATERLRSRELEFAELKRFFPPQVIDQVMARGGAAQLRSQRKIVTVLFSDLRGFTEFSDSFEPEEVMATLAEYHAAMGKRIAQFAGTLEHFAGDGFMVFFNDPVEQHDHVERAARLALAMRDDVQVLKQSWTRKGYRIDVGIGIHTGYATCGFVGYEGRRDYGVIGNTTNLAARLSDAAGPGEILVSAKVEAELRDKFRSDPVGTLQLKGFHQAQIAFRLDGAAAA